MPAESEAFEAFVAACSAAAGAIVSKFVSYPLDLMKTKLATQEDGKQKGAVEVFQELVRQKGVAGMYVGLGPKVLKNLVQKFVFFYVYDWLQSRYRALMAVKVVSTVPMLLIGVVADWIASPFVVPINYVTTQVQTSTTGEGSLQVVRRTLRERGASGFFDGLGAYIAGSWQPAIEFTLYDQMKALYMQRRAANILSAMEAFLLGFVARAFSEALTYPTELTQLVQQSKTHPLRGKSTTTVVAKLMEEGGFASLYKGVGPQLAQGMVSTAILMMVKEQVNGVVRISLSAARAALMGS